MMIRTAKGCVHDYKLFCASLKSFRFRPFVLVDKGYLGVGKMGIDYLMPFKSSKYQKITKLHKQFNRVINSKRIRIEHVFGWLKRFNILGTRYRNRRSRFGLRFNLIAAIYNLSLIKK